ncbi:MAG: homing endonuclease associated repeat-containing protein [Oscillospiraceae bacterium]
MVRAADREADAGGAGGAGRSFRGAARGDSLPELAAYVSRCAAQWNHAPAPCEIEGGSYIARRFGSWEAALAAAGLSSAYKIPGTRKTAGTRRRSGGRPPSIRRSGTPSGRRSGRRRGSVSARTPCGRRRRGARARKRPRRSGIARFPWNREARRNRAGIGAEKRRPSTKRRKPRRGAFIRMVSRPSGAGCYTKNLTAGRKRRGGREGDNMAGRMQTFDLMRELFYNEW